MRMYLYQTSRNLQGPWPHDLMTFGQNIKVKVFVQGRVKRSWPLYIPAGHHHISSWPMFHGPLTSDFGQIIEVKIFVQGRISRPINASKLIFHTRMYLYETSRNIQEPWPPDLYFTVCWLQTLADFPLLRILSKVDFWALLIVASWYFIRGFTSVRPAASAFMPRLMLGVGLAVNI